MRNVIKINDPALDRAAISRQIQQQAAQMPPLAHLAHSGPASLRRAAAPRQDDGAAPDFSRELIALIDNATLQETEFRSRAPVVGPLIVRFRRLWNWMSTRWYVLPIIRQQSDVNAQTALLLLEMAQLQEQSARRIARLEQKVADLEAQLAGREPN